MRRHHFSILLAALSAATATAATSPIFINSSPLQSPPAPLPQIDATVFVNSSIFDVTLPGFDIPFETLNTQYFTNRGSGLMTADIGFRFDYYTGNVRSPMNTWINQGSIAAANPFFSFGFGIQFPSWLLVNAVNLTNRGALNVEYNGLLCLQGSNVNVSRSTMGVTPAIDPTGFFTPVFPPIIIDDYWSIGTNGQFGGVGPNLVFIDGGNFDPPFSSSPPTSPPNQVQYIPFGPNGDSYAILNGFSVSASDTEAFVYTNQVDDNIFVHHIVFATTVHPDTNLTTQVSFTPLGNVNAISQIDFIYNSFDLLTESSTLSGLSIGVNSAIGGDWNYGPPPPLDQRPNPNGFSVPTYLPARINLDIYSEFTPAGVAGNGVYTPDLIYNPNYLSNRVFMPSVSYGGTFPQFAGLNTGLDPFLYPDPTNYPGRVEVVGNNVNYDLARITAQTTVILKAKELANNKVPLTDAPFVNLDLASTKPSLTISNLVPPAVSRLYGSFGVWSGVWTNYEEVMMGTSTNTLTNQLIFHVVVVGSSLRGTLPVTVNEFALHNTNITISDRIAVGKSMLLQSSSLTIDGSLSLPAAQSWGASNVLDLVNLTNRGTLNIQGSGYFGTDRPQPYSNFINENTINAGSIWVRATNIDNPGCLVTPGGFFNLASGPIYFETPRARLHGPPPDTFDYDVTPGMRPSVTFAGVGSKLDTSGDVQILADTVSLSNAVILAGGVLNGTVNLNVTNSLTDAGPGAMSYIWNNGGITAGRLPTNSSLLGTTVILTAGSFEEFFNVWAGRDRGPVASGYSSNLAVGRLVLNIGANSLLFFSPTTLPNGLPATNAMYVEYLELLNDAVNVDQALAIDPNFTIYFANSNLDPTTLTNLNPGLQWVSSYTGPLSSRTYTAANGATYTVNAALAASMTIDSDGDGIVNGLDAKPFYTADDAMLSVSLGDTLPQSARLTWSALARSGNTIEYSDALGSSNWQVLTNFVQGAVTGPVTVLDPLSSGPQLRVYRLRVNPSSN